jgi:membrane-associated protein
VAGSLHQAVALHPQMSWLPHRAAPTTVWVVVLTVVFLECAFIIGLFLPGDSLLFAAGVILAAHQHEVDAWALALAATVVAVLGNQVGYLFGRRTGTRILARKDGKVLNRENLAKARKFCDRWGFWSVAMARWMPWIRTLAPIIAGAAGMNNRRYLMANAIGALLWVPTLLLLGYYCAGVLDTFPWLREAAAAGSVAFFLIGTSYGYYRYRQEMSKPIDDENPVPATEAH